MYKIGDLYLILLATSHFSFTKLADPWRFAAFKKAGVWYLEFIICILGSWVWGLGFGIGDTGSEV